MRLLLDTHIFLWYISGDGQLRDSIRDAISDAENEVYLSVISVWESLIKYQIGKLPLPRSPEEYLPEQRERHLISSLPLDEGSVAKLGTLPLIHRDPFDRMLICQAMEHDLTIVTVDDAICAIRITS
ncbi:MAG TPA: type II toxin-antitoxin system VapC family toxin [Blastocatellia bacterium]|nr:type II toxin-antitoxin system VapC family toxin [Blastocatellia bacterium]